MNLKIGIVIWKVHLEKVNLKYFLMKNKIKGKVKQVLTNFCPKESWFKIRTGKDLKCTNCSNPYIETEGDSIGLMIIENQRNAHVCLKCAEYFKTQGAEDIDEVRRIYKERNEELISKILSLNSRENIKDKKNDELEIILERLEVERKNEIELEEAIKNEFVETETEQYLIDDYSIVESEYLKHELQIEDYFKDCGYEYFDCGQGYYESCIDLIVKIGNKFYSVTIDAEIGSAKQDRGDRLYWVESIENVTWQEIEKPLPKPKNYRINIEEMNIDQYNLVKKVLIENKIQFRG